MPPGTTLPPSTPSRPPPPSGSTSSMPPGTTLRSSTPSRPPPPSGPTQSMPPGTTPPPTKTADPLVASWLERMKAQSSPSSPGTIAPQSARIVEVDARQSSNDGANGEPRASTADYASKEGAMCCTQTPFASSSSSSLGARPELLAPQRTLAARTGGRQCVIASISSSSITTKENQPATYQEPSASATKLRAVGRIMESTLLEHACLFGQTSSLTNTRDPELRDREIRLHEHHRERVVAARALQTAPWLFPPTDELRVRLRR